VACSCRQLALKGQKNTRGKKYVTHAGGCTAVPYGLPSLPYSQDATRLCEVCMCHSAAPAPPRVTQACIADPRALQAPPLTLLAPAGEERTVWHTLGGMLRDVHLVAQGPEGRAFWLALGLAFIDQVG
jgi:hypothetical protein